MNGKSHFRSLLLRGGRLRKTGRGVLTYAPCLGLVAATLALAGAATLSLTGDSRAGTCSEDSTSGGTWNCSGAGHFTNDNSLRLTADSGEALVINETAGFGLSLGLDNSQSNMRYALHIDVAAGSSGGTVTLAGTFRHHDASANVSGDALRISNASANLVSVTSSGMLVSRNQHGAHLIGTGAGDITFVSSGSIVTDAAPSRTSFPNARGKHGVYATQSSTGNLNITTAAVTVEGRGISAVPGTNAGGQVTITANGLIDADREGIWVDHQGGDTTGQPQPMVRINVTATDSGDTKAITAGAAGIVVLTSTTHSGPIDIDVAGSIAAGSGNVDGIGINARGGSVITIDANEVSAGDDAIAVVSGAGYSRLGSVAITTGGAISSTGAQGDGIDVQHVGDGDVTITTNDTVTTMDNGWAGIRARINAGASVASSADIDINVNANMTTGAQGIFAYHAASSTGTTHTATGDIDIAIADSVLFTTGNNAIQVTTRASSGGVTITGSGTGGMGGLTSTGQRGISVVHRGTGDVDITAGYIYTETGGIHVDRQAGSSDIDITALGRISTASGTGIYAKAQAATGAITITVAGRVASRATNGNAITFRGASSRRLIVRPGFSFTTDDAISSFATDGTTAAAATLEFNADAGVDANNTFDLSSLGSFINFTGFTKTGAGRWIFENRQSPNKRFTDFATFTAGTMRLNAATFGIGTTGSPGTLAIPAAGVLEVMGSSIIQGHLDNSAGGSISLAVGSDTGSDDFLRVTDFVGGGTLTLNVEFIAGGDDSADTLTISGAVSGGMTTLSIIATGNPDDLDSGGVVLIDAPSTTGMTAFATSGTLTLAADSTTRDFTITRTASGDDAGEWRLMSVTDPAPPAAPPCAEDANTGGTFVCSGSATETQALAAAASEALNVSDDSTFTITVASGNAFTLTSDAMSTGMTVDLDSDIFAQGNTQSTVGDGIKATHSGTGAVSITTDGAITAGDEGIDVRTTNTSATTLTITTTALITAPDTAIYARHAGSGDLTINAAAVAGGDEVLAGDLAIDAGITGTTAANIIVNANGTITAPDAVAGIYTNIIETTATGDIRINASGNVTAGAGIDVYNSGSGNMTVSISGSVDATGSNAVAIQMSRHGTSGDSRLILNPGASIAAGDNVRAAHNGSTGAATDDDDAILQLAADAGATGAASFDLSRLEDFTGFTAFEKTGGGTWTLTGDQTMDSANMAMDKPFTSAAFMAGTLRLNAATLDLDDTNALTIASGASLEVMGASTIAGDLDNTAAGAISLAMSGDTGTDDSLSVMDFTTGGTLTLNVAFVADADGSDGADTLTISGTVTAGTEATTVNLIATGNPDDLDTNGLTLITAPSDSGETAFTAGTLTIADTARSFTLTRDSGTGDWTLAAIGEVIGTVTPPPMMPDPDPDTMEPDPNADNIVPNACTEQTDSDDAGTGRFICSGTIPDPGADPAPAPDSVTLELTAAAGQTLELIDHDDPGFTITTAMGDAFTLTSHAESTGMTVDLDGDITAGTGGDAMDATHSGTGTVSISTRGAITAANHGINASTMPAATTMTIAANGNITAGMAGINADHDGSGALTITSAGSIAATAGHGIAAATANTVPDLTITAEGDIGATDSAVGMDGINATHSGTGAVAITAAAITAGEDGIDASTVAATATTMTITANGDITAAAEGISASHNGTGDLAITANAAVSGTTGISATAADTGNILVSVGGSITGTDTSSGAAISMMGGANQTLRLRPGFSLSGDVDADDTTATLELTATGGETESFDLSTLSTFTGFTDFDKTGTGTWTLTAAQPEDRAFTSADVLAGTLRLQDAQFRPGSSTLTIAENATLEVLGTSTIHGPLENSGTVLLNATTLDLAENTLTIAENATLAATGSNTINGALSSAGAISLAMGNNAATDRLSVTDFTTGGSLTLHVSFATADGAPVATADTLTITGAISGTAPTSVNLVGIGRVDTIPETLPVLIDTGETATGATEGRFTPGSASGTLAGFELDYDTAAATWSLLNPVFRSPADAVYEGYPLAIAQFSRLSGLSQRLGNRVWDNRIGSGLWAQFEATAAELQPSDSATAATHDTQDARLRFGMDLPLPNEYGMTIGANAWLARGKSDIATADGDAGKIETDGFAVAATATWENARRAGTFYADTQFQYAFFSSDLTATADGDNTTIASNNDSTALTATAELGYRMPPVEQFSITPQAQVIWSDIDFDAFTHSNTSIAPQDGTTMSARLGLAADREWGGGDGVGLIHGNASFIFPVDGQTSTTATGGNATTTAVVKNKEASLDLGLGMTWQWQAHSFIAELATTQGDETKEYRANFGLKLGF